MGSQEFENPVFYVARDWEEFESGNGNCEGPVALAGMFFYPSGIAGEFSPEPKRSDRGLCKFAHDEKIFDRLTETCIHHYILHLERREQREYERNYGLKISPATEQNANR